MPILGQPLKSFNFSIEVDGLNALSAQEVKLPPLEYAVVEHGGTNYMGKTAGMMKTGEIEIKQLSAIDGSDNWAWVWMQLMSNPFTGGGQTPAEYRKTVMIRELAADGVTTLHLYMCINCWPSKIDPEAYKRTGSENIIKTITLTCDIVRLLF